MKTEEERMEIGKGLIITFFVVVLSSFLLMALFPAVKTIGFGAIIANMFR